MPELRIDSNRYGGVFAINRAERADYYPAAMKCGSVEAAAGFYETQIRALADLFREMAEAWHGWDGECSWRSLEGEVHLRATHDKLGTVALIVGLRNDVYDPAEGFLSTVEGKLFLDAGGLDRLARRAAKLVAGELIDPLRVHRHPTLMVA